MATADSAATAAGPRTGARKRRLMLGVLVLFALTGIAYFAYWLTVARYVESTDDAYVAGNMVQITPQVPGVVIAIGADDTQLVRAGQLLVQLDRATSHAALLRDEAALALAVREVRNLFAQTLELHAAVAAREVALSKARTDLARRQRLAISGAISTETPDADFAAIALPQLLQGAGIAMYFAPLMAIALGGLDPQRMAFGSGLANFFRTTAGSFGVSLVTTFWERREAVHRTQLVDSISTYSVQANVWLAERPTGGAVLAAH